MGSGWVLLLVALLCGLFSNSVHNEFAFDDNLAIVGNADANGDNGWGNMWVNDFWGQPIDAEGSHKSYRPFTVATFRLNTVFHQFFEHSDWYESFSTSVINVNPLRPPPRPPLRAEFFHIVNIALHGVVTLLLGRLASSLFAMAGMSHIGPVPSWFLASLLFLVHPVHVEAVTGLVGRAELLSAMFVLLGITRWLNHLRDRKETDDPSYFGNTALFVGAVLSKETGFALPILLVVLEILWNAKSFQDCLLIWNLPDRRVLRSCVMYGLVCVLYLVFRKYMTVHSSILIIREVRSLLF